MKTRLVLAAASLLLLASPSFAQTPVAPNCVTGTLASYIALGSGGCLFDSVLYRNFAYVAPAANTITPEEIIVTPVLLVSATPYFPGLNFSAPWAAPADQVLTSTISYNTVAFPPGAASGSTGVLTLDLGAAEINGIIGSVTVQQVTSTPTLSLILEVFDRCADGCSSLPRESVTVSPATTLDTSLTLTLSGGTGGVSLSSFATDLTFGVQPE